MHPIIWAILTFLALYLIFKPAESAFYKVFKLEDFYEKIFQKSRSKLEEGTQYLLGKVPKNGDWNFQQGTIALHIREEAFTNGAPIYFENKSKDGKAVVRFIKNHENDIRFEYKNEKIGTVFRQISTSENNITSFPITWPGGKKENFRGIFVVFIWDMKNGITMLSLNPGTDQQMQLGKHPSQV